MLILTSLSYQMSGTGQMILVPSCMNYKRGLSFHSFSLLAAKTPPIWTQIRVK